MLNNLLRKFSFVTIVVFFIAKRAKKYQIKIKEVKQKKLNMY